MSWLERREGPSNPDYYPDAADDVEAQLRADTARWFYLRKIAAYAETPQQGAELRTQASELAATWSRHESMVRQYQWTALRNAFYKWSNQPDQAARELRDLERAHAAGAEGVDEFGLRNLRQAGEQTGRLERGITGSEQDSARWQPVTRAPGATLETGVGHGGRPPSLLERAFGVAQYALSLDEVAAIIAGTDRHREAEGELDTAETDEHLATAVQRPTGPSTENSKVTPDQIATLQHLQNLHAEHTRTAESFSDLAEDSLAANLAKSEALERIGAAARQARVAAAHAGAPTAVIKTVILTGQQGTYWRERPGDPRLRGEVEHASTDAGSTHLDHTPGQYRGSGSPDPPAQAPSTPDGGTAIGEAVEASSVDVEHTDWQPLELPPQRTPVQETATEREL